MTALATAEPVRFSPTVPPLRALLRVLRRPSASTWMFLGLFALYALLAADLVYTNRVFQGDAFSRMGNAYNALTSRDPKLAAIGFVWSPLPILVLMPFVSLRQFAPSLVTMAFGSNLVSAACMAGFVVVIFRTLQEQGVPVKIRYALAALVALNPLVLVYGANGMSEAMFLLTLAFAAQHLARWLADGETRRLITVGLALAASYLTRYESAATIALVVGVVAAMTFRREPGDRRDRIWAAVADGAAVGTLPLAAIASWVVASWVIVHAPFEQLASVYGNDQQTTLWFANNHIGNSILSRGWFVGQELLLAAPALVLIVGLLIFGRARWSLAIAAVAVFAPPVLAVCGLGALAMTIPLLRYSIAAVPLAALLVGALAVGPGPRTERVSRSLLTWIGVGGLVVATLITFVGTSSYHPAAQGERDLRVLLGERSAGNPRISDFRMAKVIDRLGAPDGSVLVDSFTGFAIVLNSDSPHRFVITADRDFRAALADPGRFGIKYLIVPEPRDLGTIDAINRAYPRMYEDGAGIARLLVTIPTDRPDNLTLRLYKVGRTDR